MSALPKEKSNVWIHPRDRLVLGVRLRDLKLEVDRELLRSLASEKTTAPVWPVLQAVGATDAQIEGVLRLPGVRSNKETKGEARPLVHWHWRTTFQSRGETQFWLRSKLQLSGPELVACVRRLLQIPALEQGPSPAPAEPGKPVQAPGLSEAAFAELVRAKMKEWRPVCQDEEPMTPDWADFDPDLFARGFSHFSAMQQECEPARGSWFVLGAVGESDDPMTETAATVLVEGLWTRDRAEAWLRLNHAETTAAKDYDCYYVDGNTDDAAWNAAECWSYDDDGRLVSEKDGRSI
jgi:hypothetical protein